jgi:hypothetical protein
MKPGGVSQEGRLPANGARLEVGGLKGLVNWSHRPRSCPHQLVPAVEVAVLEGASCASCWGPRRIEVEPARGGAEPAPGLVGYRRQTRWPWHRRDHPHGRRRPHPGRGRGPVRRPFEHRPMRCVKKCVHRLWMRLTNGLVVY